MTKAIWAAGAISILMASPALAGGLASLPPNPTLQAQARLKEMGYEVGRIDGFYGPKTAAALKAFQKTEELSSTGSLDPQTLDRLEEIPKWFQLEGTALPESGVTIADKNDDDVRQDVIELYTTAQVDEEKVRLMAIDILASMKNERAFAALRLVLLSNSLPSVRVAAAKKISLGHDLDSLEALAFAVDFEKDPVVRAVVAHELEHALPQEHPRATVAVAAEEELPLPLDD